MYTIEYWKEFCQKAELPQEGIPFLTEEYKKMIASPDVICLMKKAEDAIFSGKDWGEIDPSMLEISELVDVHKYTVDFLFLAGASERLRNDYAKEGLSEDLYWATIKDLTYKLVECKEVYEIWGTFVASWFPWFYTMQRFKLGRLQYEIISQSERDGEVEVGGHVVKPGDKIINIHIPSCGPLTKDEREASYKAAYEFFKEKVPASPMVFTCHSYLLFPTNAEILPETSNVVGFLRDFYIAKSEENEFYDRWRIFGRYEKLPDDQLPEDTMQRRCFKQWLLQGKKTGEGLGYFLYDEDGKKVL